MSDCLSFIVANLVRSRRRTVLTVASLTVSLGLLSMLAAIYEALFLQPEQSPSQALRLIVHHRVSITQPLPLSCESAIRRLPGVREIMASQWFGGTYRDAGDPRNLFARFAVEPDKFFTIKSEVGLPEPQRLAFQRVRTSCIAGEKIAQRFNWKVGDRIPLIGDIFPVNPELTLVGIYSGADDNESLFFNFEYLRQLVLATDQADRANVVGTFLVQAERAEDLDAVSAAIDKEFENSPAPTKSETERTWQLGFIAFVGNLKLFLGSISAALTFTILLVSGNTISISLRQRLREVGILKTMGFTPAAIFRVFMGESAILALAGGTAGVLLATVACAALRHAQSIFAGLKLGLRPEVVLLVLSAAEILGMGATAVPAWIASRKPLLELIRHAG